MSTPALQNFVTEAAKSESLAREIGKAMDGSSDPSGFVALGKAQGYDFTHDEVISFFGSGADQADGGYDQLAKGVALFRRIGKLSSVPRWASRMYSFSIQADMRFW